jgi:hypothetical protein
MRSARFSGLRRGSIESRSADASPIDGSRMPCRSTLFAWSEPVMRLESSHPVVINPRTSTCRLRIGVMGGKAMDGFESTVESPAGPEQSEQKLNFSNAADRISEIFGVAFSNSDLDRFGFPSLNVQSGYETTPTMSRRILESRQNEGIADDDKTDPVAALKESGNKLESFAGEELEKLINSSLTPDQQTAGELASMLKSKETRDLAIAVLTGLENGARSEFLALLKDKTKVVACSVLKDMLRREDFVGPEGVKILLTKLTSSDRQEKQDGERLLGMLNSISERRLARGILEAVLQRDDAVRVLKHVFKIYSESEKTDVAKSTLDLLSSRKEGEAQAGARLASLDRNAVLSKGIVKTLVEIISDRDSRDSAVTMLNRIGTTPELARMIYLTGRPDMKQAADTLLGFVREDRTLPSALALLENLNSFKEPLRRNAQSLLNLLNSKDEAVHYSAETVMTAVHDEKSAMQLTDLLSGSGSARGAQEFLRRLADPGRERRNLEMVIGLIGSRKSAEVDDGRRLIKLLGGNDQDRSLAEIVLHRPEPADKRVLLQTYTFSKDAAYTIANWLGDSNAQRSAAANNFLALLKRDSGREPAESLMRMMVDSRTADVAVALLSSAGDQIGKAMELYADRETRQAIEELMKDFPKYRKAFQSLLKTYEGQREDREIYARNPAKDAETAGRLMKMLSGANKDLVLRGLAVVESNEGRDRLERLIERSPEVAEKALQFIERHGSRDSVALLRLPPDEIQMYLNLRKDTRSAAVLDGLKDLADPEGATRELLYFLCSDKEEYRKLGNELLEDLRAGRESHVATAVLKARVGVPESLALKGLLQDKDTREVARVIAEELGERIQAAGGRALLKMLCSKEAQVRETAEFLLESFKERPDALRSILQNVRHVDSMRVLSRMLSDKTSPSAGREVLRLLNGGDREIRVGSSLLSMLADSNATTRGAAEQFVKSLTSEKSAEKQFALNLIDAFIPERDDETIEPYGGSLEDKLKLFARLTDKAALRTAAEKVAADKLIDLVGSENRTTATRFATCSCCWGARNRAVISAPHYLRCSVTPGIKVKL